MKSWLNVFAGGKNLLTGKREGKWVFQSFCWTINLYVALIFETNFITVKRSAVDNNVVMFRVYAELLATSVSEKRWANLESHQIFSQSLTVHRLYDFYIQSLSLRSVPYTWNLIFSIISFSFALTAEEKWQGNRNTFPHAWTELFSCERKERSERKENLNWPTLQ